LQSHCRRNLQPIEVSYCFAGKADIDMGQVFQTLADELGTRRLVVEGGRLKAGPSSMLALSMKSAY
jgi:riboflavin biosynthesis pyrimidine reductase